MIKNILNMLGDWFKDPLKLLFICFLVGVGWFCFIVVDVASGFKETHNDFKDRWQKQEKAFHEEFDKKAEALIKKHHDIKNEVQSKIARGQKRLGLHHQEELAKAEEEALSEIKNLSQNEQTLLREALTFVTKCSGSIADDTYSSVERRLTNYNMKLSKEEEREVKKEMRPFLTKYHRLVEFKRTTGSRYDGCSRLRAKALLAVIERHLPMIEDEGINYFIKKQSFSMCVTCGYEGDGGKSIRHALRDAKYWLLLDEKGKKIYQMIKDRTMDEISEAKLKDPQGRKQDLLYGSNWVRDPKTRRLKKPIIKRAQQPGEKDKVIGYEHY